MLTNQRPESGGGHLLVKHDTEEIELACCHRDIITGDTHRHIKQKISIVKDLTSLMSFFIIEVLLCLFIFTYFYDLLPKSLTVTANV